MSIEMYTMLNIQTMQEEAVRKFSEETRMNWEWSRKWVV